MISNILITGMPRSGKSTLLEQFVSCISLRTGLFTREVREAGERTGFEVVTSSGTSQLFASIHIVSDISVSKYGVDIFALEAILPEIEHFEKTDLLYIDEIGQMQSHSRAYCDLIEVYLDAPNLCIATISKIFSDEAISLIKQRSDVLIIDIDEHTREETLVLIETCFEQFKRVNN